MLLLFACSVLEFIFLLPGVNRGETLAMARTRVAKSLARDPLLYISGFLVLLCTIKTFNSGLALEYLPDADIWEMSKPAAAGLPSAVNSAAAQLELYAALAISVATLAIRNALGPGGKRRIVALLGAISGLIGWVMVLHSFFGNRFNTATNVVASIGFFFAFWALICISAYADRHFRNGESDRFANVLMLLGAGGNTVAAMLYLQAGWMATFMIVAAIAIFWGFATIVNFANGRCLLRFICHILLLAGIVCGLALVVQPENPISAKLAYLCNAQYTQEIEQWFAVRELCTEATSALWSRHPWWGTGPNGFSEYAGLVLSSEKLEIISETKNLALNDWKQMLCEHGSIGICLIAGGFIALAIPVAAGLRKLFVCKKNERRELFEVSQFLIFALVGLLLVSIQGIFASPFQIYAMVFSAAVVLSSLPGYMPKQK